MTDATKSTEAKTFLDRRLEAATRSDDPDILRNAITALTTLRGKVRLGILVDLLTRIARESPKDNRYFSLLAHASERLTSLDRESLTFVTDRVAGLDDRDTSVALLTLLRGNSSTENRASKDISLWRRWLAARSMWPRFGFWHLAGLAAAAAALSAIALWLILLGLAAATGGGANPWGGAEATVLLTIVAIATFSAALSGWVIAAGGAAMHGGRVLALEALFWGLGASVFATIVLWLAPDALPYMAWVRASAVGQASAQEQMSRFVISAWPLLFAAAAATRWLAAALVERRPDGSATRLILVSAGIPATVITVLVMFGISSIVVLPGEMVGIWLLVVVTAYASAAVAVRIEAVPARMQALRTRGGVAPRLTRWAIAVTAVLLVSIAVRPALVAVSVGDNRTIEIPRPGARIIPVPTNVPLEVRLKDFGYLFVKNGPGGFVVNSPTDRATQLTTKGSAMVVCVLGTDDLKGGETAPPCERPSLGWIADIFDARTSFANRATVNITRFNHVPSTNFEALRPLQLLMTHPRPRDRGKATVAEFYVGFTWTFFYSPALQSNNIPLKPEEKIYYFLERRRSDGMHTTTQIRTTRELEAGSYRFCARRFQDKRIARGTVGRSMRDDRIPSSYEQLQGLSCDSPLWRTPPPGTALAIAVLSENMSIHDLVTHGRFTSYRGDRVDIPIKVPSVLIADFEGEGRMDPSLVLARPGLDSRDEQLHTADDPDGFIVRLEPGDYHLCTKVSSFGDDDEKKTLCDPGVAGVFSYRIVPLG